jgi:thiamine-monophosphate kinase
MEEKRILDWIPNHFTQGEDIVIGPGDDCAVIEMGLDKLYLLSVDQLVADIHYLKESTSPANIAKKLLKRNLSDIAAMGGEPVHALLAITLSDDIDEEWLKEFFAAISSEAKKWGVSICGGDISSTKNGNESMSLTISGWVDSDKLLLRSGAKSGDLLYATGKFGKSFESGHHITFLPRVKEAQFLSAEFANSMIDVSDGVLLDSARIAEASKLGLLLNCDKILSRDLASIEQCLTDGEDYELLFSVPKSKSSQLESDWPFSNCELTAIGEFSDHIKCGDVVDSSGKRLYVSTLSQRDSGNLKDNNKIGFDHFKK